MGEQMEVKLLVDHHEEWYTLVQLYQEIVLG